MQSKRTEKLTVLPPRKNVVFYSPIEGSSVLIRTGIMEENSLLHAILHSCSEEYSRMHTEEKEKLVKKLKNDVLNNTEKMRRKNKVVDISWKISYQENILKIVQDFYRNIVDKKSCKTSAGKHLVEKIVKRKRSFSAEKATSIIFDLVPLEYIEEKFIPSCLGPEHGETLEDYRKAILSNIVWVLEESFKKLGTTIPEDMKRQKNCSALAEEIFTEIIDEAEKTMENQVDKSLIVDACTLNYISQKFNRNIYFLNSDKRIPYKIIEGNSREKFKKSIILLWLGGNHYEIVGKLLSGKKIQREFSNEDSLIKCITTFLYRPENIRSEYPSLSVYLGTGNSRSSSRSSSQDSSSSSSESETLQQSRSSRSSRRKSSP